MSKVDSISFTAYGTPQPQGSSKAISRNGRGVVLPANAKNYPWRKIMGLAALRARADAGVHEVLFGKHVPVAVTATFFFLRPKTVKRERMVVPPDCDKLVRSCCDALKGILYHDDAQVMKLSASKNYGQWEGVRITVELVDDPLK